MADFDVVSLPETDHPEKGERAPDFERPLVNAEFWEDARLSELVGDRLLLVFHPMDGAFPATYIWNEISTRKWTDEIDVVGLSISTPYEHARFIEDREIDAPLFSDPSNGVAEEYDVVNDLDGMEGIAEARPAVFLLDADLTVEYAWVAGEWPEFPDYDEIESRFD